jgi:hypothetical protein
MANYLAVNQPNMPVQQATVCLCASVANKGKDWSYENQINFHWYLFIFFNLAIRWVGPGARGFVHLLRHG